MSIKNTLFLNICLLYKTEQRKYYLQEMPFLIHILSVILVPYIQHKFCRGKLGIKMPLS